MQFQQAVADPHSSDDVRTSTLVIGRAAWIMLQTYVREVRACEINGFGYVSRHPDGDFYWTKSDDVFITEQEVTPGSADNTGGTFAKAVHQAMVDERDDEFHLQWHSHVQGAAYHSPTDMRTIESFGSAGMSWFVSVVTNQRGDIAARLDQFRPFRMGALMPVVVVDDIDPMLTSRARADIAQLVTVRKPIDPIGRTLVPGADVALIVK